MVVVVQISLLVTFAAVVAAMAAPPDVFERVAHRNDEFIAFLLALSAAPFACLAVDADAVWAVLSTTT